jgi:hypothetical protein
MDDRFPFRPGVIRPPDANLHGTRLRSGPRHWDAHDSQLELYRISAFSHRNQCIRMQDSENTRHVHDMKL